MVRHKYNKDLSGTEIGNFRVLNYTHNGRGGAYWNVVCIKCNSKINLNSYHIKRYKSCGCEQFRGIKPYHSNGRKLPEDVKNKISKALTGVKLSEETKLKIKKSLKVRSGKDSNLWRGGVSSINKTIREWKIYSEWRKSVFERDNYTCVLCGVRGNLNADHIKPLALIIKDNCINDLQQAKECTEIWDINNGRTLCVECHKNTDSFSGKCKTNYLQ